MTIAPNSKERIIQKAIAIQGRTKRLRKKLILILDSEEMLNIDPEHEVTMIEKATLEIIEEVGK